MTELRLAPAALLTWLICLVGIPGLVVAAAVAALFCCVRQWGQAILVLACSATSAAGSWIRAEKARSFLAEPPRDLEATVVSVGKAITVRCSRYPGPIRVFPPREGSGSVGGQPGDAPIEPGARLWAPVRWGPVEGARPGTVTAAHANLDGPIAVLPPTGIARWSSEVAEWFRGTVSRWVGEDSRGLIPGMVLGDTSAQSDIERAEYVATGLSHLSAVSGANVAIVTAAVALVARALGAGPRVQVCLGSAALVCYLALVGGEPSVVRAGVTGAVGMVAAVSSGRAPASHGLSLAVIVMLWWSPATAREWGFALSVGATAGIVALFPAIHSALLGLRLPDLAARAIGVAMAADILTAPLVASMAGEVSLVSVVCNVLVAPAVPVVTVLGLAAVVLAPAAGPLVWLIQPATWWIRTVADVAADLPFATAPARPEVALLVYGWILWLLWCRARQILAGIVFVLVASAVVSCVLAPRPVDLSELDVAVVERLEDIDAPTAQVILVRDTSDLPERPVSRRDGVPVLFPGRVLLEDGSQRLPRRL